VHVEHVELAGANRAPGDDDAAKREGREVGHRPVGAEARGAAERRYVARELARFGGGPVQHPADPSRRVEGGEDADVMATTEELLGESLDVPVDAASI
jgi:hypothetical protein